MNYNNIIFGEKIPIFMNSQHTNQGYYIASANNTLSAAYKSGAFNINEDFPEDLYYWEIGEDSPYNGLSFAFRTGTSPNYTWVPFLYRNKERVPLYCVAGRGRLDADFNITPTGTMHNNYDANDVFSLQQNRFQISDTNYPLWYYNRTVSGTTNPNGLFDPAPFIVDFDYNNVILIIYINGNITLDEFIRNRNNGTKITEISYVMYAGTEDSHITYNDIEYPIKTRASLFIQNYNSDGVNILTGGSGYSGGSIRINHKFPTPDFILDRNYYNLPEFSRIGAMGGNTGRTILFQNSISTSVTPTSITSPSFYRDLDKWSFDNSGWYLKQSGENVYTEDDFNYIRKLISWLGFWFTDGGVYTDSETGVIMNRFNSLLGEDANRYPDSVIPTKIFQSEIKDGVTTGNFTELRIAKDNDQSKWGTDWREKNGYEGRNKTSPTDESSKSSKTMYESTFASFGRIYKCFPPSAVYPNGTIQSLADQLRSYMFSGNYDGSLFYNQNPVDCITSIKEYPFDISDYIETLGTELIQLGRWRVQTSDRPELFCPFVRIKSSSTPIFYGSLSIPSSFKTIGYEFLDYEPYSKYDLYLPFCGTINIPSALAVETLIEVLYFIDLLSGCCIAHIYIDNKYYCSAQGQVAVEIPVSGYQIGNYTRDMLNATYAQKQAYANVASDVGRLITSIGGSAIGMGINSKVGYGGSNPITIPDPINPAMALFSGTAGGLVNAGQIISGAGKAIQAGAAMASHYETIKYNKSILSHSAPAPIKSSLGGGIINWESPYYVEMLVQRPIFMTDYDEETYKATLGKACHIADTLANHSGGYVEAINCNLSGFPATQPEKVELAKLLADGVFL